MHYKPNACHSCLSRHMHDKLIRCVISGQEHAPTKLHISLLTFNILKHGSGPSRNGSNTVDYIYRGFKFNCSPLPRKKCPVHALRGSADCSAFCRCGLPLPVSLLCIYEALYYSLPLTCKHYYY